MSIKEFCRSTTNQLLQTILMALFGYNIFHSLFGRVDYAGGECGSWIRPIKDNRNSSVGWFFDIGHSPCPRIMTGKLWEAIFSAVFFSILFYSLYRKARNDLKAESRFPAMAIRRPDSNS